MVTPIEKRSSNKFCEFYNDKGHNTDECVQLRKQIEELVRAGKLSHFIKEIRQDRDQQKTGQKDAPVKDKATTMAESDATEGDTELRPSQRDYVPTTEAPRWRALYKSMDEFYDSEITITIGDRSSSMEVLYEHCINRIRLKIKSQMVLTTTSLTDFSGETKWPLGQLRLLVTIGDAEHYTRVWMNFMIVRSPSAYNGIIRRHEIREIQAVPSTAHGILKFLVMGGIVTIRSIILTPTECTTIAATSKDHVKKAKIRYDNFKVAIHPDFPYQEITIGGTVSIKVRTKLFTLLKKNLDIFAWQPSDMTGVPRSITKHRLNIQERYSPVRQKNGGRPQSAPRQSK
nr:reverse transcriptase domain-containing protein [Tanacetum cinerariifolium]